MKRVDIPAKFNIPFGFGAGGSFIRTIPEASQIGIQDGAASLTTGFPPLNFLPTGAGGVPPFGADVNGILFESTSWDRWFSAGGPLPWDSAFSAAAGGYAQGAVVQSTVTLGLFWFSIVDDNPTNPDTGGANWRAMMFDAAPSGQCYFQRVNSTQAKLVPKGGDIVKLNGVPRRIPSAGITLDVANCYGGGVPGQTLIPTVVYNVYLLDVAGTLVLDVWDAGTTGVHVASSTAGNVGVEIRNPSGVPDNTRTLVGKVSTDGSNQLGQNGRSVISWFNQEELAQDNAQSSGLSQVTTTAFAEIAASLRIAFLTWGTKAIRDYIAGSAFTNTSGAVLQLVQMLDPASADIGVRVGFQALQANSHIIGPTAFYQKVVAEGLHTMGAAGAVSTGNASFTAIEHCLTTWG